MFRCRYLNQRVLAPFFFDGGLPQSGTSKYLDAKQFGARYFSVFSSQDAGPPSITLVPTSIAISVSPSTQNVGSPISVRAFVYDQFGKAMVGAPVSFASSVPAVLSAPVSGFTDPTGQYATSALSRSSGTTFLYASSTGISAYTSVTVTATIGGITNTITQGATVQVGSAGGGIPGPSRPRFRRQVKRWPTR